jgi:hypothetical protein
MAEPITDYVLTLHARFEMERRGIAENTVQQILVAPDQRLPVRPGRDVLQSKVSSHGRTYLVRVIVDLDRKPAEVVTVYRTSKIEKYWRREP